MLPYKAKCQILIWIKVKSIMNKIEFGSLKIHSFIEKEIEKVCIKFLFELVLKFHFP